MASGYAVGLVLAGLVAVALFIRARLLVVRVHGPSMEPGILHGQHVLARRCKRLELTRDRVVVVAGKGLEGQPLLIIKRVAAAPGDPVPESVRGAVGTDTGQTVPPGQVVLLGDNSEESIDSRHWGFVSTDSVRAVVVRTLSRPAARAGLELDRPVREDELGVLDANARIVIRPRSESDD